MFVRLGGWCYDRRRWVVGIWLLAVIVLGGVLGAIGTNTQSKFEPPPGESKRGSELLDQYFGGQGAGFGGRLVFRSERGFDDPAVRRPLTQFLAEVGRIVPKGGKQGDVTVRSPFAVSGAQQIAQKGPLAGKVAYAEVELPSDSVEKATAVRDDVAKVVPKVDGVKVLLGGDAFAEQNNPSSEALGLAFAIVILLLAFGSVLAMGLPVGVALGGIAGGTILAGLLSHLITPPAFASILGVMIGLGVGIDYALFIVTRFRESLHSGHSIRQSTVTAIDTAGRAVLFAGTTVVISLLGLLIVQMTFVTGLAIAAATVVAVTMVASVTLLPALLGFVGEKVEVTRWRGLIAAGLVAIALVGAGLSISPLLIGAPLAVVVLLAGLALAPLKREVPRRTPKPRRESFAYRWSRVIQHHPWPAVAGAVVVLLILASPVLGLRLGFSDNGNFPKGTDTRQAYDLLADAFGPGFNGPLLVVTKVPAGADAQDLLGITKALGDDPGVAFASPPFAPQIKAGSDPAAAVTAALASPDRPAAVAYQVVPTTAPQDKGTSELVSHLRGDVLPKATANSGLDPAVTGFVAVGDDFSTYLAHRIPYFFAAVLALSFLLLMVVFRSVLVPLKAVVMNLLSIGAAYGVVVAAFQWGWAEPLLGTGPAPIEPFIPMMLFAIVFGLSMDYEVFLLSRVKEEWDRTGDAKESVADGLAATALVITAAALIMVFVFGSFLLEDDRIIKLFGTGLATAILLDATIVRMILVPATMELLGENNWWVPKWLDRILPHVEIEGHIEDDDEASTDGPPTTEPDREFEPV